MVGVVLTLIIVFVVIPWGENAASGSRRATEMVDAIVNHNKAPKIVDWPRSAHPNPPCTSHAALFSEDHDWKEEERVDKAIEALEEDRTKEVWEELVRRIGDRRYCVTVTTVKTGDAYIRTVGDICRDLAYSRLIGVFWYHLPLVKGKEGQEVNLPLHIG